MLDQAAVALGELDGGGGGREPAIGDGDVFAGVIRAPFRDAANDGNAVIAGGNRAVGNADVVAADDVDAVGPNRFFQAGVNVDAIDHHARAGKERETSNWANAATIAR